MALCGCADASGVGFGSTIQLCNQNLLFHHDIWGHDADSVSSNYKELHNLVESIEDGLCSGELHHTELFICTDNSTVEGAYYKGNTESHLLFNLVLHLHQIHLDGVLTLRIVHISGTRMIAQGTDALLRGDLTEGAMQGVPIASYLPFHLPSIDRSPALLSWLQSWIPLSAIRSL